MLLRFEVENHRSIREPVELSMIAIDKDRVAARHIEGIGDEQVLTVAGIYGANASGKTNLIDALACLSKAVRLSLYTRGEALTVDPFEFAPEPGPTTYGVDLVVNAARYRYELQVDESGVVSEALYSYPQRRRRTLFERQGDDLTFRRGTRLTGGGRELITPTTLVMSVADRLTEEISAVAIWLENIEFVDYWPRSIIPRVFKDARVGARWTAEDHQEGLYDLFEESPSRDRRSGEDAPPGSHTQRRDLALSLLKFADLGVRDAEVTEDKTATNPDGRRLRLLHDVSGSLLPLELAEESEGTLAWLRLMPELLRVLANGGLIVVDELDYSLHPAISSKLVELFHDPATNPRGGQIIFTTHDTSLLGHLNRDEVWITEKRPDGSTGLIALSDFRGTNVRRSTNLERAYLQGRFGAVPVVDEFQLRADLSVSQD
ncbi:MAG: ATP-binding protein [Acidimicrobiaceae bacterium]|nr:ATP-binding protein [Acidimicrobiia bacterium]MCY4492381.1 ATP-binding protein [Acidimicrobiaceae bacterium]